MELFRLSSSNYLPQDLIEEYDSLIWTERYTENGDFKLKSADVNRIRSTMPLGSFMGILGSTEPMIVETHEIDRDLNGIYNISVTGRTVETFLEQRSTAVPQGEGSDDPQQFTVYYTGDAATRLIRDQIINGVHDLNDRIPNTSVTALSSARVDNEKRTYSFGPQSTYEALMSVLKEGQLGIRVRRDASTVDNPILQFVVYGPTDKTKNQTVRPPVIFSVSAGHFENAKYLFSNKTWKNWSYIYAPIGTWRKSELGYAGASGFNRRVKTTVTSDLTKIQSGQVFDDVMSQRAKQEMAEDRKTIMLDGQAAKNAPYDYGTHYNLGDKITVLGDYGINEDMLVTEYIRSVDVNGEEAYPTFTSLP